MNGVRILCVLGSTLVHMVYMALLYSSIRCMAEKASFMNGAEFTEAASGVFTSITPILARAVVMRVTSLTPYVSLSV